MRIIAGEFRGRRLLAAPTTNTRSITDRVKQSLFDILSDRLQGSVVYDCFAGVGSMGLECLSRGAAQALFFEADAQALANLRQNIATLGVSPRSKVIAGDLFAWFAQVGEPTRKAEVIFLDPPYRYLHEQPGQLQVLAGRVKTHLAPGGIVVLRHATQDALELGALRRYDTRAYGSMVVDFLTGEA